MKIREIPFGELLLDRCEIYRTMGSGDYIPDQEMTERTEALIAEIAQIARPRFCYVVVPVAEITTREIVVRKPPGEVTPNGERAAQAISFETPMGKGQTVQTIPTEVAQDEERETQAIQIETTQGDPTIPVEVTADREQGAEIIPSGQFATMEERCSFRPGSVITRCLKEAEYVAFFVATSGRAFDDWLHGLQDSGDIIRQFVADAIGSEIAEATARAAAEDLNEYARSQGLATSNSYSPGYCGWHVSEQQLLFSLLPTEPCGVKLNDSSLMSPIKSVSGIIALGRNVKKMPYGCAICNKKDCYKHR